LYRGRFAPSPTGPLHLGSLLSALGSYLQAKSQKGKWLVRIEDLDPPREVKGAALDILKTLEAFGLYWDEEVVFQSKQHKHYQDALEQLKVKKLIYSCSCSRKQIQESTRLGKIGFIYPGFCRQKPLVSKNVYAHRLLAADSDISFEDLLRGKISQSLYRDIGDVVLLRADGYYAYHLAVVVDDYLQNITEIVRGCDLIDSTVIHIYLQQCLDYTNPSYAHLPIIVNKNNEKLSKQTGARAINISQIENTLYKLLQMLGQNPPIELKDATKEEILLWGETNWTLNNCPKNSLIDNQENIAD